jgi:hypothetical protein
MKRNELVALFRLLAGLGLLLLGLAFLRACFSPPMIPPKELPTTSSPAAKPADRY